MSSAKKNFILQAFFLLNVLQGALALLQIMRLPASEEQRALLWGFSWVRLAMLAVCAFGILFFMGGSIFLVRKGKHFIDSSAYQKARQFFAQRPFTLALCLALTCLVFLIGAAGEILLNPAIFPRAAIYRYLYERIRPLSLWVFLLSGEMFAIIVLFFWQARTAVTLDERLQRRHKRYLAFEICAWLIMLPLWVISIRQPQFLQTHGAFTQPLLLLSFILLVFPPLNEAFPKKGPDA